MIQLKGTRGGPGRGQGRHKSEPTKVIPTRMRISLITDFREMVKAWKKIHYKKDLK